MAAYCAQCGRNVVVLETNYDGQSHQRFWVMPCVELFKACTMSIQQLRGANYDSCPTCNTQGAYRMDRVEYLGTDEDAYEGLKASCAKVLR